MHNISYEVNYHVQTGFYLPIWKRSSASISIFFVADALQSFNADSKCLRACSHCSVSPLPGVQATFSANACPVGKKKGQFFINYIIEKQLMQKEATSLEQMLLCIYSYNSVLKNPSD